MQKEKSGKDDFTVTIHKKSSTDFVLLKLRSNFTSKFEHQVSVAIQNTMYMYVFIYTLTYQILPPVKENLIRRSCIKVLTVLKMLLFSSLCREMQHRYHFSKPRNNELSLPKRKIQNKTKTKKPSPPQKYYCCCKIYQNNKSLSNGECIQMFASLYN